LVALRRICHRPPVHVLPDRLVAVDVALALLTLVSAKHAFLERAVLLQFRGAGLELLLRHIAVAARAAELQHARKRAHARALRSVGRALGEISDHAARHLAVTVEVELPFELVTELIEIVPVARRKEVVRRAHQFEDEIARRARLAGGHGAMAKHALPMLVNADFLLDLISVHDSHGVPPNFFCGIERPCGWTKPYCTSRAD